MGDKTGIEWTEATWNPIVGCSIVSPGCTNCYAMKMAARLEAIGTLPQYGGTTKASKAGAVWTGKLALASDATLLAPLRRHKPTTYFVNSMGDVFHESVPNEWIDKVFAIMTLAPQHTFQILTKRADRMRDYLTVSPQERISDFVFESSQGPNTTAFRASKMAADAIDRWPLPNAWLGVSAEDQKRADERIPDLLATPAAVRWVSAEPLLGSIDLRKFMWPVHASYPAHFKSREDANAAGEIAYRRQTLVHADGRFLDWIVVGGESGPRARPMHPDWARSIRDQCAAASVPFFFKQWGEWVPQVGGVDGWTIDDNPEISRFDHRDWEHDHWGESYRPMWCDDRDDDTVSRVGKKAAGRMLDGRTHDTKPEVRDV